MELKDYQKQVISDLHEFCNRMVDTDLKTAYREFWSHRGVTLSANDDNLSPYNDELKGIPRVTVKVPTAGGKTFIACNAVKTIYDHYSEGTPKIVAWFVPSDAILEQTYKNLCNPQHPYRQKLDVMFSSRVQVSNKQQLLQGQGFNPQTIADCLTICVFSIQSFATRSKEGRLVYRENGSLLAFEPMLRNAGINFSEGEHPSLVDVMKFLRPVVIIDESHRFTSELSKEFFELLNPRFILNLTATPRKKSNIISFVSAMKLKQNNMVKLPVVVYNLQEKNDVVSSAINFRKVLELHASKEREMGGEYIRPIVLFQAESKTSEEKETFDKVKKMLVSCNIPEEQIKIKTANINELKGIDLMSEDCPVRYIITVNALKEGWDCPFAYILASLANKTSNIDVEQILGRILRQPYTRKHKAVLLNQSYVYSCSTNFQQTLVSIVKGLNGAGFSDRDYRVAEQLSQQPEAAPEAGQTTIVFTPTSTTETQVETPAPEATETTSIDDIDTADVVQQTAQSEGGESTQEQVRRAEEAAKQAEAQDAKEAKENPEGEAPEVKEKQRENMVRIQDQHKAIAAEIKLPQFFIKVERISIFNEGYDWDLLETKCLYKDFNLDTQDKNIDLLNIGNDNIAAFDVTDENEFVLKKVNVNSQQQNLLHETYAMYGRDVKISQFAQSIAKSIRIDEVSEKKVVSYVMDVLKLYKDEELVAVIDNAIEVTRAFAKKLKSLLSIYAQSQFERMLRTGKIKLMPNFTFAKSITLEGQDNTLQRTLYSAESSKMNNFEYGMANAFSKMSNVVFWHRNLERGKGFCINGFVNHYPDFIVLTEKGHIVMVETKGDDRDNSDSKAKLALGTSWAAKAGDHYHYYMVFDNNSIEGAINKTDFLSELKDL